MKIRANYRRDEEGKVIVPNLFSTKTISMLYGEEKIGKTFLMFYIVGCLSSGKPIVNKYNVNGKQRVLYLSGELPTQLLKDRIKHIEERYELNFDNVEFVLGKDYNVKPLEFVKHHISYEPVDFVVIDSITYYFPIDDYSKREEANRIIDELQYLSIENNCHILIVNHQKKTSSDYYGDRLIGSFVVNIFKVKTIKYNWKMMYLEKTHNLSDFKIFYKHSSKGIEISERLKTKKERNIEKIYEILRENGALTVSELQEKTGFSLSTLKRYLKELKEKGNIEKIKQGRNVYVKLLWEEIF